MKLALSWVFALGSLFLSYYLQSIGVHAATIFFVGFLGGALMTLFVAMAFFDK